MRNLLLAFAAATLTCANSQPAPQPDELFRTIASLDARLFDAYNRCDLREFGSLLAEDIEFYHDQSGLEVGRQKIVDAVKGNICGKVRRELVPGTLEVHPLAGYGAVEIGAHRFTHPGAGNREPAGEAKFVHIWRRNGGQWQLTRVVSFDHHPGAGGRR